MRHAIRGWIEIEPVAPDGNMFSPGWVHGCFSCELNWCILYHSAFKICNLWYLLPGQFQSRFFLAYTYPHRRGLKRFLAACGGERGEGETGDTPNPRQKD